MTRAYSLDLRERVIGHVKWGGTARGAAGRFGIGVATAIRWVRDWRETGSIAPKPFGKPKGSKLDAHEGYLLGLVEEAPDITLDEMRRRLEDERGVNAGIGTLWRFFDARGISYKKSPATPANRSARTSAPRGKRGSTVSPTSTPSG